MPPSNPNAAVGPRPAADVAAGIRRRVLTLALERGGGYLSQACSSAEILATWYCRVLRLGPSAGPPEPPPFPGVPGSGNDAYQTGRAYHGAPAPDTDRFIVSPAHYAVAVYAALVELGRLSPAALATFNTDGSTVEMIGAEHSPGMELTTGSFGQALSQAAGIALARRLRQETGRVWVFMSDGEFQEGQTWEGLQAASFYKLGTLGVVVDVNGQQVDGRMADVMDIEPLRARLAAFGAHVEQVNGHDIEALAAAASVPHRHQPLVVLAYTDPARGIPLLEARKPDLHYVRIRSEEEENALRAFLTELKPEESHA